VELGTELECGLGAERSTGICCIGVISGPLPTDKSDGLIIMSSGLLFGLSSNVRQTEL